MNTSTRVPTYFTVRCTLQYFVTHFWCMGKASVLGRPTAFYGRRVGLCLEHRYYSRCVNTCQHFFRKMLLRCGIGGFSSSFLALVSSFRLVGKQLIRFF